MTQEQIDERYIEEHRINAKVAIHLMEAARCSCVRIDGEYVWKQDVRDSGFMARVVVDFFMTHPTLID